MGAYLQCGRNLECHRDYFVETVKMGLSLLHSPLTATSIKFTSTGPCWLIQTLFQQRNHYGTKGRKTRINYEALSI